VKTLLLKILLKLIAWMYGLEITIKSKPIQKKGDEPCNKDDGFHNDQDYSCPSF